MRARLKKTNDVFDVFRIDFINGRIICENGPSSYIKDYVLIIEKKEITEIETEVEER